MVAALPPSFSIKQQLWYINVLLVPFSLTFIYETKAEVQVDYALPKFYSASYIPYI